MPLGLKILKSSLSEYSPTSKVFIVSSDDVISTSSKSAASVTSSFSNSNVSPYITLCNLRYPPGLFIELKVITILLKFATSCTTELRQLSGYIFISERSVSPL